MQVLISLQAMVFVKDPFFNEPGYEKISGTDEGNRRTRKYNDAVLRNTIKWAMHAPLQSPLSHPHGVFQDVLRVHWTRKRPMLLAQLDAAKERLRTAGDHDLIDEVRCFCMHGEARCCVATCMASPAAAALRAPRLPASTTAVSASLISSPWTSARGPGGPETDGPV